MTAAFYAEDGLNAAVYDERTAADMPGTSCEGDVEFFVEEARRAGGPVLELGCGTGRVTWPVAEAGLDVVGLDLAPAMLRRAEAKRAAASPSARDRVRFVHGDMADFDLGERFAFVMIPYRAIQALLEPERERSCLAAARRHLRDGGAFVVDLFDARLEWCHPGTQTPPKGPRATVKHPDRGTDVRITVVARRNEPFRQVFSEKWLFEEIDAAGRVVLAEEEVLSMRWTYRHEMRAFLELAGFEVLQEFSDFRRSPPAYGGELLFACRAR